MLRKRGHYDGFNSKLVRLKAQYAFGYPAIRSKFQFQTGSIRRSEIVLTATSRTKLFQFQTGSIRSLRVLTLRAAGCGGSFQFQTGSIRSVIFSDRTESPLQRFNSKLVRLEVKRELESPLQISFQFQTGSIRSATSASLTATIAMVSIPNWFD